MRTRIIVSAVLGIALQAAAAQAQTVYARSAKDTVRYREVTHTEIKMVAPQGEVAIPVDSDVTIAVLFLPGDSARAWYDSLRLSVTAPTGTMTPDVGSLLKQPFVLKIDSRGRTTMLAAPALPAEIGQVSDLTHQFDDFFLRLPAQPLKVGLAWTDTSARSDSTSAKTMRSNTISQFKVERDTIVGGEAAMVISAKQQMTVSTEAAVPGQDMRVHATLTGGDDGWFVFAPKSGRMIAREKKGSLSGETTMSGAMGSMSLNQTMSYSTRIDAVK